MSGRLDGKVAFITGAARGQGRAHALRMAEEGADVIAVDICRPIESNPYPLATPEDLAETERAVKELGRRIVARQGDVRERSELRAVVEQGLQELGKIDIVVAQAGILPMGDGGNAMDFVDASDVDLIGVMNAVAVSLPHLPDGASIIITGSTAAMMSGTVEGNPGGAGYAWAKNVLMGYTEQMALHLAPRFIRVNCIHPTNVNTHLIQNELVYKMFCPDIENPTREDAEPRFVHFQGMPIPYIEPVDSANLAVFLASDESRYITGQQIRIDAASLLKFPNGPA
ncbi:MAG TPA: mycofactocin-coupled SDR family oxidoreductase [Acidimicrobiales bacterium]|nr:mycofactocin-coupled SDR family oxidoreductase [Acidimicrobiales bacterium]